MTRTRILTIGAGLSIAAAAAIVGTSVDLEAIILQRGAANFGFVGIADGQTVRLNVANIRASGGFERGSERASGGFEMPAPCHAQLQLLDIDGNVLAARGIILQSGKGAYLDYSLPPLSVETSDTLAPRRAQVRASVRYTSEWPPDPCRVVTTLEIVSNATGRTMVFAQAPDSLPPGPVRP